MSTTSHNETGSSYKNHIDLESMYRVGDPKVMDERVEDNKHLLTWPMSETDMQMSMLAGWGEFQGTLTGLGMILEIPEGTRNAGSILGGVEAWPGEKRDLLDRLADYTANTYKQFKQIDMNASFGHMGVIQSPEGNEVFFAPPHQLSETPEDISTWLTITVEDLGIVLAADHNHEVIIDRFMKRIADQTGLEAR